MPKDWKTRVKTERQFEGDLRKIIRVVQGALQGADTTEAILNALRGITALPSYREWAYTVARRMVKSVMVENAQDWRDAARKGQRGHEIYRLLKSEFNHSAPFNSIIRGNADLITAMPSAIAQSLTEHIATEAIRGLRAESLIAHIQEVVPGITETRARLIARTEIAKTQAAITQVRSQRLGIKFYVWRTSHDARVRSSHRHMEGIVCGYSEPPSPEQLIGQRSQGYYNPGEIYNCRCYAEPIVDTDYASYPIKIYMGGRVQRMPKRRFLEIQ